MPFHSSKILLTLVIHDSVPKLPLFFGAKEKWSDVGLLYGFISGPNLLRPGYTYGILALLVWRWLHGFSEKVKTFISFMRIMTTAEMLFRKEMPNGRTAPG